MTLSLMVIRRAAVRSALAARRRLDWLSLQDLGDAARLVAATPDDGGVDPHSVAATIAVVALIGVGAWFIGGSNGDTETETTIENPR